MKKLCAFLCLMCLTAALSAAEYLDQLPKKDTAE